MASLLRKLEDYQALIWGCYPDNLPSYINFYCVVWKDQYYRTGICFHWSEV